jgi:pimeloyl-ACP methyl ester carboxylesterase
MTPAAARPFAAGEGLTIRGETAGEGPPVVLCHGVTATRRYVIHGSRALERAGRCVISYDARGHGESDPAPPGQGYGYPELVADLRSVLEQAAPGSPVVLAGHSMGAHTAVSFALAEPERVAGLVVIGPVYEGEISAEALRGWDGRAEALERGGVDGFVEVVAREQPPDSRWREAVTRFTRERMLLHRHLDAVAQALRQVPRSRPFHALADLSRLEVPALVVASHDDSDPGHPRAVAEAYAERLPRARLIGERRGASPLAWQGGRLAREIAAFCDEPEVAERTGRAPAGRP